jgi:hypothetical protein
VAGSDHTPPPGAVITGHALLPATKPSREQKNGKGDAYAYCKRCHPGAIAPQWTRERVREAMRGWRARYGAAPSSYDWSRTHARRRGGEALKRLHAGEWPAPSTVIDLYGTWAAALADAFAAPERLRVSCR